MTHSLDSYVCGVADAPLLGDTIGRALDRAVSRWGDREALVSPSHDVRWTWREFAARVDALAAGRDGVSVPDDSVLQRSAHLYQPGTRRPYGELEWHALLRQLKAEPGAYAPYDS